MARSRSPGSASSHRTDISGSARRPSVSPPPTKRRRLADTQTTDHSQVESPATATLAKAGKALRIFSWNVNGIKSLVPSNEPKITKYLKQAPVKSSPLPTPSLRECLKNWQWPHLICLQEVKIANTDIKLQTNVRKIMNERLDAEHDVSKLSESYKAEFCLPRDKYNATGFGGKVHGVCTLIRQDIENISTRTVDWDLEGRVLITELRDEALAVINVYAVNGTTFDYRDPSSGKVVGTRHDRKRAFHSSLRDEVLRYRERRWEVAVIGDINISRTKKDSFPQLRLGDEHVKNRADFEKKIIGEAGMIDSFRHLHPGTRKFTYRPTHKPFHVGGDRVDMGLVTPGILPRLDAADMLDNEIDRGPSDHVPLFLELAESIRP